MGFRRSLALLVAVTLVPLAVFSAVAVYQYGRARSAAAEHTLLGAARVYVVALDKHFEATVTALQLLGTSEHLDVGDLAAFHRQCLRALETQADWRTVSLFDAGGRRLLISSEPFGVSLPGPPPPMAEPFRRLVDTGIPNVSDLFPSPVSQRYAVSVGVPIRRSGAVRWVLSAGLNLEALGRLVESHRARPDWTVAILDRRDRVVVSSGAAQATGTVAAAELRTIATGQAAGTARAPGPDGRPALTAFGRSEQFGWVASITAPVAGGGVRQPVQAILGVGVALLLLGLGIAWWVGRRISRPIEALALAARQIGRGETVQPVRTAMREVAALSAALVGAGEDRVRAMADLATASERLRILHEIDRGIIAAETPAAIAEATIGRVRDLMGVPRVILNLFDLEAGEVEWLAAAGRRRIRVGPGIRFPLALMGDVEILRRGEMQTIDVDALPRTPDAEALLASGVHVYLVVPMIADGELIGALSFGVVAAPFTPAQVEIAREVAAQMAIALAHVRLYERIRRQADELEQRVQARTAELQAAQEGLVRAERLATLGHLAGSMSHELRNPLGVIKNSVYYLSMVLPQEDKIRKHLRILDREVQTATRLISGLLDFSRDRPPIRRRAELDAVIREQLDRMTIPEAVALVLRLPEGVRPVAVDPEQVGLALGNIISNAVQAMVDGGTLTIETTPDPAAVSVLIADTGSGIAPKHLEKIFEPLFTTRTGGIGLGLSLARRLVEANGGRLSVESRVGQGSRFTLRFPWPEDGP